MVCVSVNLYKCGSVEYQPIPISSVHVIVAVIFIAFCWLSMSRVRCAWSTASTGTVMEDEPERSIWHAEGMPADCQRRR